jgi:hypothetical protein
METNAEEQREPAMKFDADGAVIGFSRDAS